QNAQGEEYGTTNKPVESFYGQAPFIDFWTEAVKSSLMEIPEAELQDTAVVVSAHSLPETIKEHSDPYPDQLEETAELSKKHADLQNVHGGWQSEGNTPDPWLGPDVQDLTRDLHKAHGYRHFIYLPVRLVSEPLAVVSRKDDE